MQHYSNLFVQMALDKLHNVSTDTQCTWRCNFQTQSFF